MRAPLLITVAGILAISALTWLWRKTESVNPEDHARVDTALRELRSLDRTVNQDVLRARFQLIDSYHPVLQSYRRIQDLEADLATPPSYLDQDSGQKLGMEVAKYRDATTNKQRLIETFKYRTADLKELLAYLPGAGTGVAQAAQDSGEETLARDVNRVLQLTLIYNLTSDESYAPVIRKEIDTLQSSAELSKSHSLKRRVRTLAMNVRRLLKVKPEVDRLLARIFAEPVTQHEEKVASVYYAGYTTAEGVANRYRILMYGLCIVLLGGVAQAVVRLRISARALSVANEHLEERVAERTRELNTRNREMRAVLDNVDQALFTVDLEGKLSHERSAMLDRWLPEAKPGTTLWDAVRSTAPKTSAWFKIGWDDLTSGMLPQELVLDQMPSTLTVGHRHYEIEYRPIGEENHLEKVLLVMTDVTDAMDQAQREADQHEQLTVFQHLMKDRPGLLEFFGESGRIVASLSNRDTVEAGATFRAIHTLKGNCALYGVASVATVCHRIESKLVDTGEDLSDEDRNQVTSTWSTFADRIRSLVGTAGDTRIAFTQEEINGLRQAIISGRSSREVLRMLAILEKEPTQARLTRIAEQAKSLARRLGKGDVDVSIEANGVRLDTSRWAHFWASFVHMLRNALDHGIESGDERLAAGKSAFGHLILRTREVDRNTVVEITDDGRGINWDAVRAKVRAQGLADDSGDDPSKLLFRGGVSTKDTATEYSGRGAGVSACYNACADLGGKLSVESTLGKGTTFRFTIPSDEVPYNSILPPAGPS